MKTLTDTAWLSLLDFPDYEISNSGRVRRLTRGGRRYPAGYELKAKRHKGGYDCYSLIDARGDSKTMLGHRLVALAFLGDAPTDVHEVAHNDGVRTNNNVTNLRWATPQENQADRKLHGTHVSGDTAFNRKLTSADVKQIRDCYSRDGKRYSGGAVTMQALADRFDVSITQVSRIINGTRWQALAA